MEKIERLESYLYDQGVDVVAKCYRGLKGYYRAYPDGYTIMAISPGLTLAERTSVTYHEAGHHHTMIDGDKSRTEARADRWAAKKLVPVQSLIDALMNGCRNSFDVAEHIGVSENFLYKKLDIYQKAHGDYLGHGEWTVWFRPLMVHNYMTDKVYPAE
jgi:Zn-dependent peptidase ImmA (M78 family)